MNDKRQIIGNLYALRAGLSLIHDENKKIKAKETVITKIDETVQENNKRIEGAKLKIRDEEFHVGRFKEDRDNNIKDIAREKREIFFNWINFIFFPVGAFLGLVAGWLKAMIEDSFFDITADYSGAEVWAWVIGGAIVGYIGAVIWFYFADRKKYIEKYEISKSNNIAELNRHQAELCRNECLIDTLKKESKKLTGERVNAVADYNAEKDIVVPVAKSMFIALLNQFSSLLDSRDWKNLDLIIFYLETGRADTIKEALSQVDRQNQMDRLTEAINEASATICKTLERSFASLENCINENFENLSYQLSKQHREQMGALKGVGSSLSSINSRLDQISVNSAMQTSLLNNISINSNELANVATHIYEYGVKSY